MINWPIIPMTYNDSFTYMEWLGKLTYVSENLEGRVDQVEKDIIDLWHTVENHEGRITELETWRRETVDPFMVDVELRLGNVETWREETVDPFIQSTTETLNDYGNRITQAENDIDALEGRMGTAEGDIDALETNLRAEEAARANTDQTLSERLNNTNAIAVDAQTKVNKINIELTNVGSIRYFLVDSPTGTYDNSDTVYEIEVPDEDWGIVDVRGHYGTTEFRVTGSRNSNVVTAGSYKYEYDGTTNTITLTIIGSDVTNSLDRLDFILYKSALTPDEQEQAARDFYDQLDANGDGKLDARDASAILGFYSWLSTGGGTGMTMQEAWEEYCDNVSATSLDRTAFPDFNGDGKIDARDASAILGYYSWASTTDLTGIDGWEALQMYLTQRDAE